MQLCKMQGNGICLNCSGTPKEGYGEICRDIAALRLDLLSNFLETRLTYEQQSILDEFNDNTSYADWIRLGYTTHQAKILAQLSKIEI